MPSRLFGAEMGLIIWAPRLNGYRIMPFKLEIERGVVSTSRLFGAEMGLRIWARRLNGYRIRPFKLETEGVSVLDPRKF